jgi:uncharacterized protein YkwD
MREQDRLETQLPRLCRFAVFSLLLTLAWLRVGCLQNEVLAEPEQTVRRSSRLLSLQSRCEETVFSEINRFRRLRGLRLLRLHPQLQQAARDHSLNMARYGYFDHYDLEGKTVRDRVARRVGGSWTLLAENIAKDRAGVAETKQVCKSWMKSPGHRKNILHAGFSETGVGAVVDLEGNVLLTQVFLAR